MSCCISTLLSFCVKPAAGLLPFMVVAQTHTYCTETTLCMPCSPWVLRTCNSPSLGTCCCHCPAAIVLVTHCLPSVAPALQVYLVFACSILEQDLMFVVYNVPTVGICRAEQRAKACQKLGVSYTELGGLDYDGGPTVGFSGGKQNGAAAAAAQQQHSRKRAAAQASWSDGLMMSDGLMGGDMAAAAAAAAAAMAAGGDPNMGLPMQVCAGCTTNRHLHTTRSAGSKGVVCLGSSSNPAWPASQTFSRSLANAHACRRQYGLGNCRSVNAVEATNTVASPSGSSCTSGNALHHAQHRAMPAAVPSRLGMLDDEAPVLVTTWCVAGMHCRLTVASWPA